MTRSSIGGAARRAALFSASALTAVVLNGIVSGTAHADISSAESIRVTGFSIVNPQAPDSGSVTLTGEYSCTGPVGVTLVATFAVTAPAPGTATPTVTGLACPVLNASYSVTMTLPAGMSADAGRFAVVLRNSAQGQLAADTGDLDRLAGTMNEVHVSQLSVSGGSILVTFRARCTAPSPVVTIVLGQGTVFGVLTGVSTQAISGCDGTVFQTYTATVTPVIGAFGPGAFGADIGATGLSTVTQNGSSASVS